MAQTASDSVVYSVNSVAIQGSTRPKSRKFTRTALLPALALLFVFLLALLTASRRMMAYDELATYEPAHLPTMSQTLAFYEKGLDTPSPIPAVLLHLSMEAIGNGEIRNRLIFILPFLGMCALLYVFAARRYPPHYAILAILAPAALWGFVYATEMRAYSCVLFFSALMLVAWQNVSRRGHSRVWSAVLLWVAFAGAVLSHVFSVFLFLPFALAEAHRSFLQKRIQKSVWVALFTAPFSLVLLLGAIRNAHHYYGADFWSKPQVWQIAEAYQHILGLSGELLVFLALVALFFFLRLLPRSPQPHSAPPARGFTAPEWTLIILLLAYPFYAFVGALPLGVFVFRYALPFMLGATLALIGLLAWGSYFSRGIAVSMIVLAAGLAVAKQHSPISYALHSFRPGVVQQYQQQHWIANVCRINLPILTGSLDFFMWQHYAPPCVRDHLYYAPNPTHVQFDTGESNMTLFSRMAPLKVTTFKDFTRQHNRFLALNVPWLDTYIRKSEYKDHFKVVEESTDTSIYNNEEGIWPVNLKLETVQQQ